MRVDRRDDLVRMPQRETEQPVGAAGAFCSLVLRCSLPLGESSDHASHARGQGRARRRCWRIGEPEATKSYEKERTVWRALSKRLGNGPWRVANHASDQPGRACPVPWSFFGLPFRFVSFHGGPPPPFRRVRLRLSCFVAHRPGARETRADEPGVPM